MQCLLLKKNVLNKIVLCSVCEGKTIEKQIKANTMLLM